MSKPAIPFGVVLFLAIVTRAEAQVGVSSLPYYYEGSPVSASYTSTGGHYIAPTQGPALAPYSYYTALPQPARTYVGYGSNDFPFQGRPYGSPSDRWSWYYMGGPSPLLYRYFAPPL